jgi:hypothetical protein
MSTTVITECISWLIKVTDNNDARWKQEINSFIHSLIHSFYSLSYMSIGSSKVSSEQSVSWCFLFQFPVSSRSMRVIQQLFMSSSSSYRYFYPSLYIALNNMKTVSTQDVTSPISLSFFNCM